MRYTGLVTSCPSTCIRETKMPPASDWRSSATYEYLNELDPAEFAWEYLRRNPEYQRDFRTIRREPGPHDDAEASARLWGLRFRG